MATATRKVPTVWLRAALCLVLCLAPLVGAVGAGTAAIGEDAYATFSIAEALAGGRAFPFGSNAGRPESWSPLWVAMLATVARLGLPVPWLAQLIGAAAWSLTTLAIYDLGRRLHQKVAGSVAALLVAFGPLAVAPGALGSHAPWAVCLAWWAVWATATDRLYLQAALLFGLLAADATVAGVGLTVILLLWRLRRSGRWPWAAIVSAMAALVLWWGLAARGFLSLPMSSADLGAAVTRFLMLTRVSTFLWFYAAAVAWGLTVLSRGRFRVVGLFWPVALAASGSTTGLALSATLTACIAGLGIAAVGRWLVADQRFRLAPRAVLLGTALVGLSPLLVAGVELQRREQVSLPVEAQALLAEAAAYVRLRSDPDDVILGSARVGYLAARTTMVYAGTARDAVALSDIIESAGAAPPDWVVSVRSLGWDDLVRTGWFQSTYFEVASFASTYATLSPVTVWQRRPAHFDVGVYESLNVRLPDGRFWVGYTYEPDRITGGGTVSVTLYVHEPHPVADARGATVYLRPPGEGGRLAQASAPVRQRVVLEDPEIGVVRAETFGLETPADLGLGAYYLSASLFERSSDRFAQIYQDDLVFPIDRVTLGYVVRPWSGDMGGAAKVGADLGHRATLVGYELGQTVAAGSPLAVTLYWEGRAGAAESSAQHFVFVHLLDGDGNLVAQHDGPPADGRYPLQAWIPGEVVPDTHILPLGQELPAGTYRLRAGMYTWPTLERLPAWDAAGAPLADGVVILGDVSLP